MWCRWWAALLLMCIHKYYCMLRTRFLVVTKLSIQHNKYVKFSRVSTFLYPMMWLVILAWYNNAISCNKIQNMAIVSIKYIIKNIAWNILNLNPKWKLSPRSFLLFSCRGIFHFIAHDIRILCCGREIKVQKVWRISFEKKEKFYYDFTKTLFFLILHAQEPRHKIFMSWSMKFKYVTT